MEANSFKSAVHDALAATPIIDLLGVSGAVILERFARGGGATKWYYCPHKTCLEAVEEKLSPGSAVSFYFDDRIRNGIYSSELKANVERIITELGEVIVGVLCDDHQQIAVEIISGANEFAELASRFSSTSRVFYGGFPSRDNDGVRAVTVVLPDADGVVRSHPH